MSSLYSFEKFNKNIYYFFHFVKVHIFQDWLESKILLVLNNNRKKKINDKLNSKKVKISLIFKFYLKKFNGLCLYWKNSNGFNLYKRIKIYENY